MRKISCKAVGILKQLRDVPPLARHLPFIACCQGYFTLVLSSLAGGGRFVRPGFACLCIVRILFLHVSVESEVEATSNSNMNLSSSFKLVLDFKDRSSEFAGACKGCEGVIPINCSCELESSRYSFDSSMLPQCII